MAKQQHNPNVVKHPPNINECSVKDLNNIQGIGEEPAERIVRFRREHGRIESPGQLQLSGEFDAETIRKLQEGVRFS